MGKSSLKARNETLHLCLQTLQDGVRELLTVLTPEERVLFEKNKRRRKR